MNEFTYSPRFRQYYKKNLRILFPIGTILFIIAFVIAMIITEQNPGIATRILLLTGDHFNVQINPVGLLPTLVKNLVVGFIFIASGCIPYLFLPALLMILEGVGIGVLLGSTSITSASTAQALMSIIPHNLFQIPAMLIAGACGMYLCTRMIQRHKQPHTSIRTRIIPLARIYIFLIVPLMIITSIVEVFITPLLMSLV